MVETITSGQNLIIKKIRSLRGKKGRDDSGEFVIEGIHHVAEAIAARWHLSVIVYSEELLVSNYAITQVSAWSNNGGRLVRVPKSLFQTLVEKENPQGILAVAQQRYHNLSNKTIQFAVAMVNPQDPGNVGAMLRTLDAVSGDTLILLDGGVDAYHPSSVRASMGAIFWKPIIRTTFNDLLEWRTKNQVTLIGSSAHAEVNIHDEFSIEAPVILLLGSEQKGLNQKHISTCDAVIRIPMDGKVSSLNLAVAGGILLYAIKNGLKNRRLQ